MRSAKLTALNAAPKRQCVVQYRGDIENVGESPAVEHFVKLRSEFRRTRLFRMQQRGCEYMDVTIPEAGRDCEVLAIDLFRARGDAKRSGGSESPYFAVMDENGAVVDGSFFRRSINLLRAD